MSAETPRSAVPPVQGPALPVDATTADASNAAHRVSRRDFLGLLGAGAATAAVTGCMPAPATNGNGGGASPTATPTANTGSGAFSVNRQLSDIMNARMRAVDINQAIGMAEHVNNGDEDLYFDTLGTPIASFSKSLPHNEFGEPEPDAYRQYVDALNEGTFEAIERVPRGGSRRLVNPLAGLAYSLESPDPQQLTMPPAPAFASVEIASEMVELYWMAVLRDIPFNRWDTDPDVAAAIAEVETLPEFLGPRDPDTNAITPQNLFRGLPEGCTVGPYISQFLLRDTIYGTIQVPANILTAAPMVDYQITVDDWLNVQDGGAPQPQQFDVLFRYIRNLRDLGEYVHRDVIAQAYSFAALQLVEIGAKKDEGIPYIESSRQEAFATFGIAHFTSLVNEVSLKALNAVWYQKWFNHRRLRPESYGGRVHMMKTGRRTYPIQDLLLDSQGLSRSRSRFGTFLLPQIFPEGGPAHPAYGAGHATVAAACVTVLKAFFDEDFVLEDPVVASDDGLTRIPYTGPDADRLTVGGELNKLASNIALGRNGAGVHYRSDFDDSLLLGEQVAIGLLRQRKVTYAEDYTMSFTGFFGDQVVI